MGAPIYTSAMVLPYNASAITTLDRLEPEQGRLVRLEPPYLDIGGQPSDIAYDAYKNAIYVAKKGSNTVSVVDRDTLKISTASIPVPIPGPGPHPFGRHIRDAGVSIAIDNHPLSSVAYVANEFYDTLYVIDSDDIKLCAWI